jgi:hypothetical protein
MDFFISFLKDFFNDGYSHWFAIGILLSCIPLVIDIAINGWKLEDSD